MKTLISTTIMALAFTFLAGLLILSIYLLVLGAWGWAAIPLFVLAFLVSLGIVILNT